MSKTKRCKHGVRYPHECKDCIYEADHGPAELGITDEVPAAPAEQVKQITTLADELPIQIARVRDEVIPAYQAIGPGGNFAISTMRMALRAAERATQQGDVVAMIKACARLKGFET